MNGVRGWTYHPKPTNQLLKSMMNGLRTTALMAVLLVLFALMGRAIGGASGMLIAFGVAVALNVGSYWFSDKIVLKTYKAREVGRADAPELVALVDALGIALTAYFLDVPLALVTFLTAGDGDIVGELARHLARRQAGHRIPGP